LASGIRDAQLYAPEHPLVGRNVDGLLTALKPLLHTHPSVTLGVVENEFVVADTPLTKASGGMKDLIDRLRSNKVERISFERGVTADEVIGLMLGIAQLSAKAPAAEPSWHFPHIRVGRITSEEPDATASSATWRRFGSSTPMRYQRPRPPGKAPRPRAGLMSRLPSTRSKGSRMRSPRTDALVALTAMRSYDNYTFTHMVNVSILTMGQARALGIEGRLLREFGLSALMHDIGKVRTPKEILQKPERLTDQEFVIMRRHPVEGAEILRRTPEMPILAPVVAFEHHLRLDGTGYPEHAKRPALNLGP
jgi:putative nucleotidyltransferase with HDIG domain